MSRNARYIAAVFALAVAGTITACASAPRGSAEADEQAIRELDARWVRAIAAKDMTTIMSMFAPDAYVMPANEPLARGTDQIRASWDGMLKMPNVDLSFTTTDVQVAAARDMAFDVGTYRMSFDSPQGRVNDEGKYTTVWRKIAGEWKVASDISNSSKPMPEPPPAMVVMMDTEHAMMHASGGGMQWSDLAVPGFRPGMKIAAIHGDPAKSGGDYTIRLKFPDGYEFPAHFHPNAEHLTVLQGTFTLGMGTTTDRASQKTYMPGDFLYIPGTMPHFGGAKGETTIQLHGIGPFTIQLAKP